MSSQTTPESDGVLTELDGRTAVRFARRLAHSPERVWRALTEPEDLEAWFPAEIRGDLATPGAELSFPFREGEAETEPGEVLASEPPRLLAFRWGAQTLRFELEPDDGGTRLVFTHALDRSETAQVAAGWEIKFEELEALLAGKPQPEFDRERWTRLHDDYAADFGVDTEQGRRALRDYEQAVERHRARKRAEHA
jgi:uncharacterized protein YndB with AHSA1/START domain